jgi:hypothetical protein
MFILIALHVRHFSDGNQTVCPTLKNKSWPSIIPKHREWSFIGVGDSSTPTLRRNLNQHRYKQEERNKIKKENLALNTGPGVRNKEVWTIKKK